MGQQLLQNLGSNAIPASLNFVLAACWITSHFTKKKDK
jgi:hypothetical protein